MGVFVVKARQRLGSAISYIVLLGFLAIGTACSVDNMYPTLNYSPPCRSGGYEQGAWYCMTDGRDVRYWYHGSISLGDVGSIEQALHGSFGTTILGVSLDANPTFSGAGQTDIIYIEGAGVPSSWYGMTYCTHALTSTVCDQHYVRFRTGLAVQRSHACHETGHAVGLTHGHDAYPNISNLAPELRCLRNPNPGDIGLGSFNADQIDAAY